jgi:hypothetical protein
MSLPFTFGVELEMCIAFIEEGSTDPDPTTTETKPLIFPPLTNSPETTNAKIRQGHRVIAHIESTIAASGYEIDPGKGGSQTALNWEVVIDSSIRSHPDPTDPRGEYGWEYQGIEVRSR